MFDVHTTAGLIRIDVHTHVTPKTSTYVTDLVERGVYDGSAFYRSTSLGVERAPLIQGGPWSDFLCGRADRGPDLGMLADYETTTDSGLRHVAGTVSLARDLVRTGNGLPEWFICLDDYPDLDFGSRTEPDERGFPAFGTVVEGLDVVRAISERPSGGSSPNEILDGQMLLDPVEITRITIG